MSFWLYNLFGKEDSKIFFSFFWESRTRHWRQWQSHERVIPQVCPKVIDSDRKKNRERPRKNTMMAFLLIFQKSMNSFKGKMIMWRQSLNGNSHLPWRPTFEFLRVTWTRTPNIFARSKKKKKLKFVNC